VCHGDDGKGGHTGGAPLDKMRDLDAAIATVTNGRNNMPPFRARSRRSKSATSVSMSSKTWRVPTR
jgi:mono/diheme cytochrome c family protein